jgi:folate-binding protein YgfZ
MAEGVWNCMKLYKLPHIVLRVSGDVKNLLDGITSNTLDAQQNAFLDRFGKIVVVFWQLHDDDSMVLVFHEKYSQRLYEHIKAFLFLSDATVKETKLFAYFDFDGTYERGDDVLIIRTHTTGKILLTQQKIEATVSDHAFLDFRLVHNMPIHGLDYDQEMALNVSEDFVSFTKGCFLGQEIVARVKNLGKPPKRLVADLEQKKFVFVDNNITLSS